MARTTVNEVFNISDSVYQTMKVTLEKWTQEDEFVTDTIRKIISHESLTQDEKYMGIFMMGLEIGRRETINSNMNRIDGMLGALLKDLQKVRSEG